MAQLTIFDKTFSSPVKRERIYPSFAYDLAAFKDGCPDSHHKDIYKVVKRLNKEYGSIYWCMSDKTKEVEIRAEIIFSYKTVF